MHRFQSSSTILRFRLASVLLVLGYLLGLGGLGVLGYSLLHSDREFGIMAVPLLGVAGIMLAFHWVVARRTHCPLCMTPVLATKHCSKHRRARKFLGSHRLRVALAVIFRNTFTCPYCNERSELKVREKRR